MANSAPELRQELLDAVGVSDPEELFVQIPADHRIQDELRLPRQLASEAELSRHLRQTLSRNVSTEDALSFLGGGVWPHFVPAVCDELAGRTEFVTSEWGTAASDHGRNQAWFEFASQMGELLDLDFVGLPVYSWGNAAGYAIRMAARMTGRNTVLIPAGVEPERLAVIRTLCAPPDMEHHIAIVEVATDPATGRVDVADLTAKLTDDVAGVYLETPNSLGVIETEIAAVAAAARANGTETILGVDPISLGVLAPPGQLGVDIAVGSTQPLGVHMHCGGGVGGFIATRDEERYARQYPTLQVSIAPTRVEGEVGFTMALFEQSSYGSREHGKDWTGNSVYLWTIVNAVYLSLMGPQGFRELGELILQRSHYAAARLGELPGVSVRFGGFFKELVVDLGGRNAADVLAALRERDIFGGIDLTGRPGLDGCLLVCVTEVHAQEDIDRLVEALGEVTR